MIATKIAVVVVSWRVGHTTLDPFSAYLTEEFAGAGLGHRLRFHVQNCRAAFRHGRRAAPDPMSGRGWRCSDVGRRMRLYRPCRRKARAGSYRGGPQPCRHYVYEMYRRIRSSGSVARFPCQSDLSAHTEQAFEQAGLMHRLDRAMHPIAQTGIAMWTRRGPGVGAAGAKAQSGHVHTPRQIKSLPSVAHNERLSAKVPGSCHASVVDGATFATTLF